MIDPVMSITTIARADERRVELLTGVELAELRARARSPRRHHARSSRVQRLSRPRSARSSAPARSASRAGPGPAAASPAYTWIVRTSSRRPTSVDSGPTYRRRAGADQDEQQRRVAPSARPARRGRTRDSAASLDAASRSCSTSASSSRPLLLPDPPVDVVAELLPVAGLDLVDDARSPRATCTTCSRTSARRRAAPVRRGPRRAARPPARTRRSRRRGAPASSVRLSVYVPSNDVNRSAFASGLHTGAIEQVAEQHALPFDVGDAPTRDALEVARATSSAASRAARRT